MLAWAREALVFGIGDALHALLVAAAPEQGLVAFAAVALAAVALAALAAHAVALPAASGRSVAHPRRSIDESAPLTQSDPDAAGHSRPRAPGRAVPAA